MDFKETDVMPPTATTAKQVDIAAQKTNTSPTEGQKDYGNYKKARVRVHGMLIAIENPKGAKRSGTDPSGKTWSQTMRHHYGYFMQTDGYDGDPVDVFLGPNPKSNKVFVVDQVDPGSKRFDEHKVMMGFDKEE